MVVVWTEHWSKSIIQPHQESISEINPVSVQLELAQAFHRICELNTSYANQ